jgi:hypothetical protein
MFTYWRVPEAWRLYCIGSSGYKALEKVLLDQESIIKQLDISDCTDDALLWLWNGLIAISTLQELTLC